MMININPIWAGINYERFDPEIGHISERLNVIKYHLILQPFAMALYETYDQYCSGNEYVTNFEIGLVFTEIIAGLSFEFSFSIVYVFISAVT